MEEVAEYCNTNRCIVSSDVLEYGRTVEVLKSYMIGPNIEVNPEGKMFDFTTKLS